MNPKRRPPRRLIDDLPLYLLAVLFAAVVFAQTDPVLSAEATQTVASAPPSSSSIPLEIPEWLVAMLAPFVAEFAVRAKKTKKAVSLFYMLRDVFLGLSHFCEAIGKALDRVLQRTKENGTTPPNTPPCDR